MKKILVFISALLITWLTGCSHEANIPDIPEKKILKSSVQLKEDGTVSHEYRYDKKGNLIFTKNSRIETSYKYDSMNRTIYEKRVNLRTGSTTEEFYEYDAIGYIHKRTDDSGTTKTKYITNGETGDIGDLISFVDSSIDYVLEEIFYPADGSTPVIKTSYEVDSDGNYIVKKNLNTYWSVVMYSSNGLLVKRGTCEDINGELSAIVISKYDELNRRIFMEWPNDVIYEIEYDSNNHWIRLTSTNNGGIVNTRVLDSNGNILYINYNNESEYRYEYDRNNNLLYKNEKNETESYYEYDRNNNCIYEETINYTSDPAKFLKIWKKYNKDNLVIYEAHETNATLADSNIKEIFYEYNEMKDMTYRKTVYLDDTVSELRYKYKYYWY